MRHRKIGRMFNRSGSQRLSMIRNMVNSLIYYECIKTTLPKAKELRRFVEPLITFAKFDTLSNRRLVFSRIFNDIILKKLFNKLGPKFLHRPGGYTCILKCGFRLGDSAPMAYIKFVE